MPTTDVYGDGTLIAKALENAFASGDYSDLTVTCQGRIWLAHKVILCTQSEFFKGACQGGFKESTENHVDLPEDEPNAVDRMLEFLYTSDYKDADATTLSPMMLNIQLVELADKYMIRPLAAMAIKKFNDNANAGWATPAFAEAVVRVFSSDFLVGDAESLKLVILEVARLHAAQLFDPNQHAEFRQTILTAPQFLLDYTMNVCKEPYSGENQQRADQDVGLVWYKCPGFMCRKQKSVFCVSKTVPDRFLMNCPLRCTRDQSIEWWAAHKTWLSF